MVPHVKATTANDDIQQVYVSTFFVELGSTMMSPRDHMSRKTMSIGVASSVPLRMPDESFFAALARRK